MASAGKVLIIVQNLPVPFDRRVWLEAKTLREAGYGVSIISPKGKHGKFQEGFINLEGINVFRYPAPPEAHGTLGYMYEFIYCWIMTAILSLRVWYSKGFDVIQACNPPETYFLLGMFYKIFGKKFIFDHHDLSPEMYLAKGGKANRLLYRGLLLLEKLTFKTADLVITTNQSHKMIAVERGNFPPDKVFIVRSGPDFERLKLFDPDPALKQGFPYLGCYLGEMCPQDGLDYLLKIIQKLVFEAGRKDIKFVLMGGGPSLEELRVMNAEMGLEPYVEFTGRVSDEDLCRFLSTADVCLDPDPYTAWSDKSTMNKIMEYMAFGKPIVAFDLTEHRFSAQEAAVYAEPNDIEQFSSLIEEILANPEKQKQMGEFGQKKVHAELSWSHSKPHLLRAYASLKPTFEAVKEGEQIQV